MAGPSSAAAAAPAEGGAAAAGGGGGAGGGSMAQGLADPYSIGSTAKTVGQKAATNYATNNAANIAAAFNAAGGYGLPASSAWLGTQAGGAAMGIEGSAGLGGSTLTGAGAGTTAGASAGAAAAGLSGFGAAVAAAVIANQIYQAQRAKRQAGWAKEAVSEFGGIQEQMKAAGPTGPSVEGAKIFGDWWQDVGRMKDSKMTRGVYRPLKDFYRGYQAEVWNDPNQRQGLQDMWKGQTRFDNPNDPGVQAYQDQNLWGLVGRELSQDPDKYFAQGVQRPVAGQSQWDLTDRWSGSPGLQGLDTQKMTTQELAQAWADRWNQAQGQEWWNRQAPQGVDTQDLSSYYAKVGGPTQTWEEYLKGQAGGMSAGLPQGDTR